MRTRPVVTHTALLAVLLATWAAVWGLADVDLDAGVRRAVEAVARIEES